MVDRQPGGVKPAITPRPCRDELGYHAGVTSPAEAPVTSEPVTAGRVFTLAEMRELRTTSNLRGAWLVVHAWAVIAGAMTVCAIWPSPLTIAAAVLVIGSRQLGLMVLMHEAGHWLLFKGQKANDRVARWLCIHPLWAMELKPYRRAHHLHHRYTGQAEDPDLAVVTAFPVTRGALWRAALGDLSGVTALKDVVSAGPWREPLPAAWRRLRGPLAVNAALLAALAVAGRWYLYPLLWLVPMVTWLPLVTRLRSIAEHAMAPDGDDPLRNSRTTGAGLLARAFLSPYWVNYHLEHHLIVFVPCWKLRRVHQLLLAKGYRGRMELAPSYPELIRRAAV
jgi:fatty acid desaturase